MAVIQTCCCGRDLIWAWRPALSHPHLTLAYDARMQPRHDLTYTHSLSSFLSVLCSVRAELQLSPLLVVLFLPPLHAISVCDRDSHLGNLPLAPAI